MVNNIIIIIEKGHNLNATFQNFWYIVLLLKENYVNTRTHYVVFINLIKTKQKLKYCRKKFL